MSITSNAPLEAGLQGKKRLAKPYEFGKQIEWSQPKGLCNRHNILFNKGRYFETSIYNKELIQQVSNLTGIKIEFGNMIVAEWDKMEDFVIAMNILGYYVKIEIDWI